MVKSRWWIFNFFKWIFHFGIKKIRIEENTTKSFEWHNFRFLDGSHDYNTVKFEADFVAQKQLKDDVIIYDDYNNEQYPGLVEACNEISKKYNYKKFFFEGENNRNYLIAKKQ